MLRRSARALQASKLLHGSAWVLVGLGIQAVLGFSFWTFGARVAAAEEVGRASAIFTIIQFVNYATGLGLTVMLARFATDSSRESNRLFGWSVVATTVSSVIGALVFAHLGSDAATGLITGSPTSVAVFAFYVAGVSVGLLADVRFMAARRWGWLVGRIALVGAVRLPLVLADPDMGSDTWLYHLMLAPLAIGGWASVPLLRLIGTGRLELGRPETLAPASRFAGVNWLAALASTAPQFVLPLVVAAAVDPSVYAGFFLAWTVTGMVLLVPGAISQILLVEGAKDVAAADDPAASDAAAEVHRNQAFRFSLGIAIVCWVGAFGGGRVLTLLLGDGYDVLAGSLPSLVFAGIPWAFTSVRLSEARLRRDQPATIAVTGVLGVTILGLALAWVPAWGIPGATRSWIIGNVAAAIVAEVFHRRPGARRAPVAPS